jgi:hypothetical protein
MAPNSELPHVLVLPEDDANRQIANGFHLNVAWQRHRQMQVLPVAGGWTHVIDEFQSKHIQLMRNCPARIMVLLIDYDGQTARLGTARASVPADLVDRVFILGALTRPEQLKPRLGAYEEIGAAIANGCREGTGQVWEDGLLRHNAKEVERLQNLLCSILFPPA